MKSMYLALVSLVVTLFTLFYVVCVGVETNHSATLISVLGTLVTALIGWNIVQYIFAKDTMEKIAKEVSEPIASDAAKSIADDINHIFEGKLWMQKANDACSPGEDMIRVDMVFQALNEYSKCQFSSAVQSSVDVALQNLQKRLQDMKGEVAPRVLEDKKASYAVILEALHSPYLQACSALLDKAREMPKEYDKEIVPPDSAEGLFLGSPQY